MNILHLSDTPLSGSPIRISNLIDQYTEHSSRHIVWDPYDTFEYDIIGSTLKQGAIWHWFEWADVIHYHNRHKKQKIFERARINPPEKPSVIQIHNPRESEDFRPEVASGLPIAVLAQYHERQWPEKRFIVPNVVDINRPIYRKPAPVYPFGYLPIVSFAPSSTNGTGWDDKGYLTVSRTLKRMRLSRQIYFQLLTKLPHHEVLEKKHAAHIGIDDVKTGSYHLNSLEYLAFGIPCMAYIDEQTERVVKDLTGADELPWVHATTTNFKSYLLNYFKNENWSIRSPDNKFRRWMEAHWNPQILCDHYIKMYEAL